VVAAVSSFKRKLGGGAQLRPFHSTHTYPLLFSSSLLYIKSRITRVRFRVKIASSHPFPFHLHFFPMATAVHAATLLSPTPSTSPSSYVAMSPRKFALAQVHSDVCLVQVCSSLAHESCHSALSAIEAQIYAHEFITIFRYSHPAVLHPSAIRILEWLDDRSVLDEEDKGTVFLARDVMERLRRLTDRRLSIGARSSFSSRGGRRML